MWKYIIVLGVVLLLVIISFFVYVALEKKEKAKALDVLNNGLDKYELIKAKKKSYDYVLRLDEFDIYVRVLVIPNNSQICINAKETWVLSSNYVQRTHSYSSKRYMSEIEYFLKNDIKASKRSYKLILLNRMPKQIIRYLNETELEEVDIKKSPYGYKITSYETFKRDLDVILKDFEKQ